MRFAAPAKHVRETTRNDSASLIAVFFSALMMLLLAVSCSQEELPDVPGFDELGFSDSLDVIRQQALHAYESWEDEPRDATRNGQLGMVLSIYGKNTAAEVMFRRAVILAPDEFRWTYYLATALQELGRYEEAAEMFRAALEMDAGFINARIQLADALLKINRADESAALYRQVTVEAPDRVKGWLGLGLSLDRIGDQAGALAALKRARIVGPQYGEVYYALATILSSAGEKEGAAREFAAYERTKMNKIAMLDPLIRQVLALHAGDTPHMERADQHLRYGRLDEAVASFRAALIANPVNQDAWSGLVYTHSRRKNLGDAERVYEEALAAGVKYARLHLTFGRALLDAQKTDAARTVIARAVELDPNYVDALSLLGEIDMQLDAPAAAVENFSRALVARPNDRRLALLLARALNATGQFGKAAGRLESLRASTGADTASVLKELAVAYAGMNRKQEAIEMLQQGRDVAESQGDRDMVEAIDELFAQWRASD